MIDNYWVNGFKGKLLKILSINVALFCVILVGSFIMGSKLIAARMLLKFALGSWLSILGRFMLKSPIRIKGGGSQ